MGHDRRERSGAAAVGPGEQRLDVPLGSESVGVLASGLWGGGAPVAEPDGAGERGGEPEPVAARRATRAGHARGRSRTVRARQAQRGRYVRAVPAGDATRDLAWAATLRRAGPAPSSSPLAVALDADDLMRKQRMRRPDRLLLFVVDASGSMAGELTALARRAAVLALRDAYVARERVAMIAFRATSAELLFGPTNRVERVRSGFDDLPLGGTTPLARGLELALDTLRHVAARDPDGRSTLILISDGRANVGSRAGYESVLAEVEAACRALAAQPDLRVVMVDATEAGKDGRQAARLADELGAERIGLAEIRKQGADPAIALRDALRH